MRATKTLFCDDCYKAKRPHNGEMYFYVKDDGFVFGRIKHFDHKSFGYTPHLVEFKELYDDQVIYSSLCAMNNCGIKIVDEEDGTPIMFGDDGQVIILHEDEYYHFNAKKIAVPYKGNIHYHFTVIKDSTERVTTLREWNSLLHLESDEP